MARGERNEHEHREGDMVRGMAKWSLIILVCAGCSSSGASDSAEEKPQKTAQADSTTVGERQAYLADAVSAAENNGLQNPWTSSNPCASADYYARGIYFGTDPNWGAGLNAAWQCALTQGNNPATPSYWVNYYFEAAYWVPQDYPCQSNDPAGIYGCIVQEEVFQIGGCQYGLQKTNPYTGERYCGWVQGWGGNQPGYCESLPQCGIHP
jgi:hypothetical protein